MALIQCKECGHMISDKATKCPKCGAPNDTATSEFPSENEGRNKTASKWVVLALALAIVAGIAAWFIVGSDGSGKAQETDTESIASLSEKTGENTDDESSDEVAKDTAKVATVEYDDREVTLEGTCDETPIRIVVQLKGETVESGEYTNLDSGTKMNVKGTWEGKCLTLTGQIQDVTYQFVVSCNSDFRLSPGIPYYGEVNIKWPDGEKIRGVELTITD